MEDLEVCIFLVCRHLHVAGPLHQFIHTPWTLALQRAVQWPDLMWKRCAVYDLWVCSTKKIQWLSLCLNKIEWNLFFGRHWTRSLLAVKYHPLKYRPLELCPQKELEEDILLSRQSLLLQETSQWSVAPPLSFDSPLSPTSPVPPDLARAWPQQTFRPLIGWY